MNSGGISVQEAAGHAGDQQREPLAGALAAVQQRLERIFATFAVLGEPSLSLLCDAIDALRKIDGRVLHIATGLAARVQCVDFQTVTLHII